MSLVFKCSGLQFKMNFVDLANRYFNLTLLKEFGAFAQRSTLDKPKSN